MATEVGAAYVSLVPTVKGFARKMSSEVSGEVSKAGASAGEDYGEGFSKKARSEIGKSSKSIFGGLAKGALAAVAGLGVGKVLKDSVSAASDLNEVTSKSAQIFGKQAMPALEAYADAAASGLGQSKTQALEAASTFGVFGKAAGLTGKNLAGFSTDFTTLASDMASFSNTSPADAITAITAALRGENDPIERYGVLINDVALKSKAMSLGLIKATKDTDKIKVSQLRASIAQKKYTDAVKKHGKGSDEAIAAEARMLSANNALGKAMDGTVQPLTAQQKVLAAQALIYEQTADAQGDFHRTQAGLANQTRIASAQFDTLKQKIGVAILPAVTSLAGILTSKLMPPLIDLADKYGPRVSKALGDMVGKVDVAAIFDRIATAVGKVDFGGIADTAEGVFARVKTALGSFDLGSISASVGSIDWSTVGTQLSGIATNFAKLGPVVKDFATQLPGINDALSVTQEVTGFLADHTDELAKAMPFLIGAYVAVKAGQLAANVASLVTIPLKIIELGLNRSLAKSIKELAAAQRLGAAAQVASNVVTEEGTALTVGQRVATIAQAVASKAVAVATKAWAVVQWLLNAAMLANPIGLIVIGIIALVAIIVIVIKKMGGFSKVWAMVGEAAGKAWEKIKEAFAAITGVVMGAVHAILSWLGANWKTLLLGLLLGPFGLLVGLIASKWDAISGVVKAGVDKVINFVKGLPGKLLALGGAFADAGKAIIGRFVDGMKNAAGIIAGIAGNVWDTLRGLINGAIDSINAHLVITIPLPGKDITIDPPDIPRLASGARVTSGTLAVIGEGRQPETVLPDSMLKGLLDRTRKQAGGVGELTITNWVEGTGYFRLVATGEISDEARFRRSLGALHA